MALSAKYVTFIQPADGSLGVQTITGVGFQGKALLLWSTLTPGHVATTGATQLFATTDGVTQSVRYIAHPGAGAFTSAQASQLDCLIFVTNPTSGATPTVRSRATFSAWTADGFTITWTTNTVEPLGGPVFHALVLGGPDLQVAIRSAQITVGAGGTVPVTGVGFEPDAILLHAVADGTLGLDGHNRGAPWGGINGVGWSDGAQNALAWTLGRGVSPTDTYVGLHTDRLMTSRHIATAADLCAISITATSGDGFTVTRTVGTTSYQPWVYFLCLKGVRVRLGTVVAPAVPGPVTVPLPFRPRVVVAQTHAADALNTTVNGMSLMLGAWVTGSGQGSTWIGGTDNATPSVFSRSSAAGYLVQTRDPTTQAVTCQGALTTVTPSSVTLNFNVTAPMRVVYLAIGSVADGQAARLFTTGGTTGPLSWMELMLKTDAE